MDIYKKKSAKGSVGLWYSPSIDRIFDVKLVPDCLYFPSILEYKVFRELVNIFGKDNIEHHKRVTLIPEVKGVNKRITWDIDFYIPTEEFYIEAKGVETEVYKLKKELFLHIFENKKTLIVIKDYTMTKQLIADAIF